MASTTAPSRPTVAGNAAARSAPVMTPGGRRQRRWSLALVALLVTLGSALGFAVLWMNAGGREPVLALANDVPAGQHFEADDLTVVRVAVDDGITPLASSTRDDVIGRPAAADLLAGQLLVPNAIGDDDGLQTTEGVIAIPIDATQVPAGIGPGSTVALLQTTAPGQAVADPAAGGEGQMGEGRVFSVDEGDDSSTVNVTVKLDASLLPRVANAIVSDRIYVALVRG
jgi:hypothetical protein